MKKRSAGSGTWGCPGWKPPWHSLLFAASLLSKYILLSQAARRFVTVVADPEFPAEGEDVAFLLQGAMEDFISCRWYREFTVHKQLILIYYPPPFNATTMGLGYTHREQILTPLCSLQVTNLMENDSATYAVSLDKPGLLETGRVELEILGTSPARRGPGDISTGAIAGIILGCMAVATIILGVLYFRSAHV